MELTLDIRPARTEDQPELSSGGGQALPAKAMSATADERYVELWSR